MLTPLIIATSLSYLTCHLFESHSIYTRQLAARKELITHHKDKAVLSFMSPRQLIETNFTVIPPDASLGELVKVVANSSRNLFPVAESDGTFVGIVTLDNIRQYMFDQSLYQIMYVRNFMTPPEYIIDPDEPMESVVQLFQKSDRYNLPVAKNGKYIGFISRANVFSQYRELLKKMSDD